MSTGTPPTEAVFDVDAALSTARILVCCGAGGVGKTTTAAALAVRAAELFPDKRVAVLTIDPARRLAQSMGLTQLDNTPRPVTAAHGSLDAMMLDMKRTFDEIVLAHAAPDKAQQIFDNPFYQALSSSFAGTQEYMAMEKLGQLQASGMYDLIIVDTPPTRSALDFLDAPTRMTTLLDSRVLRVLMAPAKAGGRAYTRVLSVGFTAFSKVFTRILGTQLLNDVGQFVAALETMFGGFRQRAESTYRLLGAPGTAFVVIAAPEPAALREAAYFVDRLQQEHMPLAGVVINRVQGAIAGLSVERSLAAAQSLAESGNSPVVEGVLRLHAERTALAARHERLTERFTEGHPDVPVARVGAMAEDVHDLDGLRAIGAVLAGAAPAATQAAG